MMSNVNVDKGEIARFGKLAATWWDPRGEMGRCTASIRRASATSTNALAA